MTMHHAAIAIPGGFACAYRRPNGELCAVSEHATRDSAHAAATQRNAAHAAMLAAQQSSLARHREHAYRRPVRWFEPDAFA